jgi:hypothetical protein
MDLDALAPEALPGLRLLPIVHDRVELAAVARAVLDAWQPAAVAVELPTTLADAAERAAARLPRISIVLAEQRGEPATVWVVAPGDPLAEALRWARERNLPRLFVDPDVPYAERHADPVPDPYALWTLGAARYLGTLAAGLGSGPATPADVARETGMAYHLGQALAAHGKVLALVGAAHVRRVAAALARPAAIPFARQRRQRVELRHLHPESLTALLPDAPLAHAAWELLRDGVLPPPVPAEAAVSRRVSLLHHGLRLLTRERLGHRERQLRLAEHAARAAARELPGEGPPAIADAEGAVASSAARALDGPRGVDRVRLGDVVWDIGTRSWREQTEQTAAGWQRRVFRDYSRRHARVQGLLAPGLYEWVVAARGVADDNLAWEVFDAARAYPWQEEQAEIPTARLDGDDLDLGTRKVRFRRRFFRSKQRTLRVPVRQRPTSDDPAEWLSGFDGEGMCSYPPEDVVIEGYARYLQHKARSVVAAERQRSEPFSGSMLDGIDLRETLRRLHEGRIWVEEKGRAPGEAGSVVVIFEAADPERFPWRMTWHGEHDQESDMAFYSTDPAEQVVGPGILRATYGGFLMTYPPGRLDEVWADDDYRELPPPDALLAAGIDYSLGRLVVHVARHPPPESLRRRAALQGKRIVHVPLGSLSPASLRKLRVVHVLAGKDKRPLARDYVW